MPNTSPNPHHLTARDDFGHNRPSEESGSVPVETVDPGTEKPDATALPKGENPAPIDPSDTHPHHDRVEFGISYRDKVIATMVREDGKIVVRKDSRALDKNHKSFGPKISSLRKRQELVNRGILVHDGPGEFRFTKSHAFDSLSQASSVILGRNSNGHRDWKEKKSGLSYRKWKEALRQAGDKT